METINKHIGKIRSLINQYSDDSDMTNEYLYSLLKDARALLLKRKADSFHKLSAWDYQEYCIGLEKAKAHNCDCVKVGCDVLKTKFSVPRPIIGRNKELITVLTFGGQVIPYASEEDTVINQFDDMKKNKASYWIDGDSKIVIWNNLDWKAIRVRQVPADPTEWTDVQLCNEDGEEQGACFDITEDNFPIDASLNMSMYKTVLELLNIDMSIPDDQTNDANDDIKN